MGGRRGPGNISVRSLARTALAVDDPNEAVPPRTPVRGAWKSIEERKPCLPPLDFSIRPKCEGVLHVATMRNCRPIGLARDAAPSALGIIEFGYDRLYRVLWRFREHSSVIIVECTRLPDASIQRVQVENPISCCGFHMDTRNPLQPGIGRRARCDWRAPGDAHVAGWLAELHRNVP